MLFRSGQEEKNMNDCHCESNKHIYRSIVLFFLSFCIISYFDSWHRDKMISHYKDRGHVTVWRSVWQPITRLRRQWETYHSHDVTSSRQTPCVRDLRPVPREMGQMVVILNRNLEQREKVVRNRNMVKQKGVELPTQISGTSVCMLPWVYLWLR